MCRHFCLYIFSISRDFSEFPVRSAADHAALALLSPAGAGAGRQAGQSGGLAAGDRPRFGHFGVWRCGGCETDPGHGGQGDRHPVEHRIGYDIPLYPLLEPGDPAPMQIRPLARHVVEHAPGSCLFRASFRPVAILDTTVGTVEGMQTAF